MHSSPHDTFFPLNALITAAALESVKMTILGKG